jgi:peptidoglycan/xylan/chitin deacetylase (PgdA/CDA1 family)
MNKIINFHQVKDGTWFDKMVCYLKSKYLFVTADVLSEFYERNIKLNNSCHITIDDGDKSFYDIVFPILRKYNVPASIYISPKICKEESNYWFQEVADFNSLELKRIIADMSNIPLKHLLKFSSESILKTQKIVQIHEVIKRFRKLTNSPAKSFQNMSVDNLKEVFQTGLINIGAHTINHPILMNEDDFTSKYEITESINELSNLLNHEIKYFAYPNGIPLLDFSERERSYLRESGIKLTFSTESKNLSLSDDKTSIPRIGVSDAEGLPFFNMKMLLGSNWETITRLKPTGEKRERNELNRIFSSNIHTRNLIESN